MPQRAPAGGFTYLGLIILVAVIGLVGAASLKVGSLLQRAQAEEELLDIGAAFSDALRSYAAATPQGQPQQPPTLQELLKDPRFPNTRRHLRKIFVDPMTGKAEWGIMYLSDKVGVLGVYSLSNAKPLKVGNFDQRFLNMENKEKISDWKFTLSSQTMVPAQLQPGTPPPNQSAQPSLFATPPLPNMAPPETPAERPPVPPEPPPEATPPEPEPVPAERPMEPKSDEEKAEEEREKAEAEKADAERKDQRPEDTRGVERKKA